MAIKIQMPKLSDTMDTGRIIKWLKKEGDKVSPGDVLAEVETDKANMDMEAYDEGILLRIVAKEGDRVPIGGLIGVLGSAGEDVSSVVSGSAPVQAKAATAAVAAAPTTAAAPVAPVAPPATAQHTSKDNGRLKASPLAKRLAKDRGIDLETVKGSGTSGRIVKHDIESFVPSSSKRTANVVSSGEFKDEPLTMMREAIAKRLSQSNVEAPHFFLTVEVSMENAIAFRESLNTFDEENKISFNDIIVKACAVALQEHPEVNATFMRDKIRMFGDVHVGVAVAIEDGLITPVVRDVDKKGLRDISLESKDLAARARTRKRFFNWCSKVDMFGSRSRVCPHAFFAEAISFNPLPVITATADSSGLTMPDAIAFFKPATPVTPAGSPKTPPRLAVRRMASNISSSDTAIIVPIEVLIC